MPKIILDTNVLVSALIQKSYPYFIVNKIFAPGEIEICVSEVLLREYYEVLRRKKFSKYPDFYINAERLIADIERKATLYQPKIELQIISDLPDNRLLELADESDAEFLVTGNTNDFKISNYKKTEIVSPKEYYELHYPIK